MIFQGFRITIDAAFKTVDDIPDFYRKQQNGEDAANDTECHTLSVVQ